MKESLESKFKRLKQDNPNLKTLSYYKRRAEKILPSINEKLALLNKERFTKEGLINYMIEHPEYKTLFKVNERLNKTKREITKEIIEEVFLTTRLKNFRDKYTEKGRIDQQLKSLGITKEEFLSLDKDKKEKLLSKDYGKTLNVLFKLYENNEISASELKEMIKYFRQTEVIYIAQQYRNN